MDQIPISKHYFPLIEQTTYLSHVNSIHIMSSFMDQIPISNTYFKTLFSHSGISPKIGKIAYELLHRYTSKYTIKGVIAS